MRYFLAYLMLFLPVAPVVAGGCPGYSYGKSYSQGYGNYSYSASYQPGYYWYKAGLYDGRYYPAGWWSVYNPVSYVPYFAVTPIGFSTYQQTALVPQRPLEPLTQVPNMQATGRADPCAAAIARFEQRLLRYEQGLLAVPQQPVVRPVRPPPPSGEQISPPPRNDAPKGSVKGGEPSAAEMAKVVAAGLAVFQNKCMKCHGPSYMKDGKGVKLFEGKTPVLLTSKMLLDCYKDILSGRMPKEDQLSLDEGQSLVAYFDTVKTAPEVARK